MVQKDTRRRSSLILGILLALLLGVAAGLFVLAVPIRMLETVTTFTRLSTLMVQAEPPISPSDRTLLAVLAGILTSGVGWVLVDWLLFGRAGLNTLIKPREDEYEDEDGDSFRPTDPLDLVSPVSLPIPEWNPLSSGDARRPLSARTDIGDPPKPAAPFGAPGPQPSVGEAPLNPFGQILPGVGTSAPPLQPVVPPLGQQPSSGVWGVPDPAMPNTSLPASWPPLDLGAEATADAPAMAERAAPSVPGWLPVPGARPDGGQPGFGTEEASPDPAKPLEIRPTAIPPLTVPPSLTAEPQVDAGPVPPLPQPVFPTPRETFAAPPPEPLMPPPLSFEQPVASQPVAAEPVAIPIPAVPKPAPPPPVAVRAPASAPASASISSAGLFSEGGFDKARLEELLVRLEQGLQKRRAAAAVAASAQVVTPAPAMTAAPTVQPVIAASPAAPVEPPVAYAARTPEAPPPMPIHAQPPIEPAPALSIAPVIPQPSAPAPAPVPIAAPAPLIMPQPPEAAARNDGMLDQPLHVTLDLLRSMVKR